MQIEWRRIWKVLLGCVCTAAGIALLTCGQLGWGLTALEAAVLLLALQYAPRGTRLWKTWWFAELVLALAVTAGCAGVATVREARSPAQAVVITTERNVLEVARNNGIDIPSLCYCENLSIYGGCRLCLVENDRGKMDAACSMQPRDGMVVNTHTKQVLDSRRTTLQLLMSSHRADCLTCDQSGRCKLQECARRDHVDEHRFEPNTYCTEPMDLSSPSIVRDPSKCILCGLCVRTCAEIQNIGAVDFSGRGKKAHISADFGKTLKDTDCVGCGQCAAVCPTGAITIRNETEKFWSMLQDQTRKVVVQYAPSVRVGMAERFGLPANEPCTGKLVAALRRLGADVVYDTNLTADLTIMEESAEFLEKVKTGAKLPMFTSCCPRMRKATAWPTMP